MSNIFQLFPAVLRNDFPIPPRKKKQSLPFQIDIHAETKKIYYLLAIDKKIPRNLISSQSSDKNPSRFPAKIYSGPKPNKTVRSAFEKLFGADEETLITNDETYRSSLVVLQLIISYVIGLADEPSRTIETETSQHNKLKNTPSFFNAVSLIPTWTSTETCS